MAKIFLRYNFSSVAQNVVVVWYANSAPNAEIDRWVLDDTTDHEKNGAHAITGIAATMHTIKFYQSSDGSTLDTLLPVTVNIDASIYNEIILESYEYRVGRGQSDSTPGKAWADPSDGDDTLNDERLAGIAIDDYQSIIFEIQGFGKLQSDEFEIVFTGGVKFFPDRKFNENERITLTRIILVAQQVPEAEVVADLKRRPLKDADFTGGVINFDSTLYGKRCPVFFTGQYCKIVFPDFALIPPGTLFEINTFQGSQFYCDLQFSSGDTVYFNGQNKNAIHLPKMEMIRLGWDVDQDTDEVVCYVDDYKGKADSRGQIIGDTGNRSSIGPYLSCEETPLPLNGLIYTGLYNWLLDQPGETKVDMATWDGGSKTFWAIDTVAKTFRPPKVANLHRRFKSGSEPSGTYVADDIKEHDHFTVSNDVINNDPPGVSPTTYIARSNELNNNSSYRLKGGTTVATLGPTSKKGGTENTVKAYREIPLVIL